MKNYSLSYMFNIAVKYWIAIVLSAVVVATAFFSYYNFIAEPKYSARGSIFVTNGMIVNSNDTYNNTTTNKNEKVENTDIVASINFADTLVDMLKTPSIYKNLSNEIADEHGIKCRFDRLMARTKVVRRSETTICVDVTFTASDPKEAVTILNEYLALAPEYINSIVKNASSYVEPAVKSSWDYPSNALLIMFGAACGAAVAYIIIFLIYSSSNVIRDEDDFREHFDINIIGIVPDFAVTKTYQKKYRNSGGNKNGK